MTRVPFRVVLLLLVAGASTRSAAPPADWPNFRGPDGSGISAETNLPTQWSPSENIAWKTDLPGPGASSPILFSDRIYLTTYTGFRDGQGDAAALKRQLHCLNRADGKIRWSKEIPAKQPEQEKIREGHGYATSTPAADAERVYVFFGKSGVIAFDHDGKQLWQADVGDKINGWGSAASPVLYKNLVIINASVESGALIALDRATGKEIWRAPNIKESWNTPIIAKSADGRTELLVAVFQKVLSFDPDTGKPLWSCATGINWYMAPSLVAADGVVYAIGGRTGGALAVRLGGTDDITATHRLWTASKGSNVTSPVFHEGRLYWMHENNGVAYCADAKTGNILYEERLPRADQVYASPVLADGKIHYITRTGRAFVLAAKPKFELLATNEIEPRGMFNSTPAVADKRIFVRSDRALYCIEKK